MQPFSVGHAVLLQKLRSPFASLDLDALAEAGLGEVSLALLVCSRPWRRAEKLLKSWRGKLLFRWYGVRLSNGYLSAGSGLFQYIEEAWTVPKMWEKPSAVVKSSPEVTLANVISVLCERGQSREEVYDMSLRLALHEVCHILHARGVIDLITEHDDDLLAEADKLRRQIEEGEGGVDAKG